MADRQLQQGDALRFKSAYHYNFHGTSALFSKGAIVYFVGHGHNYEGEAYQVMVFQDAKMIDTNMNAWTEFINVWNLERAFDEEPRSIYNMIHNYNHNPNRRL